MTTNTFVQPLLERLMVYLGVRQTLNYASTSRSHALARKWLIENCALVDHRHLTQLHEHGINPQNVFAMQVDADLNDLPPVLTHLIFMCFDEPLDNVKLPPMLTHLSFGPFFNQSLQTFTLPASLTHLTLGDAFNQPLDNVRLPKSLTHLTFGFYFDQPLDNVTLPPTLTHLTFGADFNQPLETVTLPSTLTQLTVDDLSYGYSLEGLSSRISVQKSVPFWLSKHPKNCK